MSRTKVSILRCSEYELQRLKLTIHKSIELAGYDITLLKDKNVLLKPNLLSSAPPEKAITTNPVFLRAVAEIVFSAQPKSVTIGDSPGIGNGRKIMRDNGIESALSGLPVEFGEFVHSHEVVSSKNRSKKYDIAKEIHEADIIINLPKVKTHSLMGLTCAVKNLYGSVVGMSKGRYHLEHGKNIDRFASMIAEICYLRKPELTIVDGILAMDGNGPGSGDPYDLGLIFCGTDPLAIDKVVAEVLSLSLESLPQFDAAKKMELGDFNPVVCGEDISSVKVSNFKPAPTNKGFSRIPPFLMESAKKLIAIRPTVDVGKCKLCGECVKICPPEAMKVRNRKINIDRNKCINCFCCQEICPHKAIEIKRPLIGRIIASILK